MARVHERGGGIGVEAEQRVVAVAVAGVLVSDERVAEDSPHAGSTGFQQ